MRRRLLPYFEKLRLPAQAGCVPNIGIDAAQLLLQSYAAWAKSCGRPFLVLFLDIASAYYAALRPFVCRGPLHMICKSPNCFVTTGGAQTCCMSSWLRCMKLTPWHKQMFLHIWSARFGQRFLVLGSRFVGKQQPSLPHLKAPAQGILWLTSCLVFWVPVSVGWLLSLICMYTVCAHSFLPLERGSAAPGR